MKYMGSKNRIAKHILPIILKDRKEGQWYVEPFCGGCNTLDKVTGNRIGGDSNHYLISLWKQLLAGWVPPDYVSEEEHNLVKKHPTDYEDHYVAFVRIGCSFGADWNGGFARNVKKTALSSEELNRTTKSYCRQSKNNMLAQIPNLRGVNFIAGSYDTLLIPEGSIIYCDPPYEGTQGYKDSFDHSRFWNWCREQAKNGAKLYVSEYSAPPDFELLWSAEVQSSLNNGESRKKILATEKLFTYHYLPELD